MIAKRLVLLLRQHQFYHFSSSSELLRPTPGGRRQRESPGGQPTHLEIYLQLQTPGEDPTHPVRDPFTFGGSGLIDSLGRTSSFLNKIDLLKEKLESGVRFDKYVVNYGRHPNDVPSVTSCEVLGVQPGS